MDFKTLGFTGLIIWQLTFNQLISISFIQGPVAMTLKLEQKVQINTKNSIHIF